MPTLRRGLTRLGTLLHSLAGELVLKGENVPSLGAKVYDENLDPAGYVSNVFGPVKSFFVAVKLTTDKRYGPGAKFYLME